MKKKSKNKKKKKHQNIKKRNNRVSTSNYSIDTDDSNRIKEEIHYFLKYFRNTVKEWFPKERVKVCFLHRYLGKKKYHPEIIFEDIWKESYYTEYQFVDTFKVSHKEARQLLICSGYIMKDDHWDLEFERINSIRRDLKSVSIIMKMGIEKNSVKKRISLWRADRYSSLSRFFDEKSRKARFHYNAALRLTKHRPAYNRVDNKNGVFLALLLGVCFLILCYIVFSVWGIDEKDNSSSVASQIALSLLTLLIGVVTTFLVMKQNYKIDYHQERLSVLPVFGAKLFLVENGMGCAKDYNCILKDIVKKDSLSWWDTTNEKDNIGIVCFTNLGKGAAYELEVMGRWDDFENPELGFCNIEQEKYIFVNVTKETEFTCLFYDIYGNYYSQVIHMNDIKKMGSTIDLNSEPPLLELRTQRLRYVQ